MSRVCVFCCFFYIFIDYSIHTIVTLSLHTMNEFEDCYNFYQTATCEPRCMNGGRCVAPNKCSCPSGYKGKKCHKGELNLLATEEK